jgi:hypothetical protein
VNIAYLILAHQNPEQVIRLINRLDAQGISFFIHIDKKFHGVFRRVYESLQDRPNCFFVKRETIRRGTFTQVKATLNGIRQICDSKVDFDFVITLSGQDYPLKRNHEIEEQLRRYKGKQLLEHFALPHDELWPPNGGLYRIERYRFWLFNRYFIYPPYNKRTIKYYLATLFLSLLLDKKREVPHGFKPYGGSDWWCLSGDCIGFVNDLVKTQTGKDLLKFYRYAISPNEMFIHTVVMNSHLKETVVNDNLRYIDWSSNLPHPAILTKEDFERLMSSDKLFARKFDSTIDSEVLDLIDKDLDLRISRLCRTTCL